MGRARRVDVGGMIYYALNRANFRSRGEMVPDTISPLAEEPYDKLKRALRAEIDEAAWSALYSTTRRPFDPPKTGKIAIKVINHYGDEVLKVYPV